MRNNPLGRTGLFVSELCLGTMTFGGSATASGARSAACSRPRPSASSASALDAGINFIDTADVYADGRVRGDHRPGAEESEGAARERGRRDQGLRRDRPGRRTRAARRAATSSTACKASLKRLQLDHVDLYQIHGFDPATPIEETRARARPPGAARPRALRRRFELGGLADREGAGHRRAARAWRASRSLQAYYTHRRPRPRARTGADAAAAKASA